MSSFCIELDQAKLCVANCNLPELAFQYLCNDIISLWKRINGLVE